MVSSCLQKVCPAVVVGGCGFLPCTKTLIYLYICVMAQPRRAGAETKYCTTHVSGVHESHFYFSTKKVIFPTGSISLHFCERPFSTRADFDLSLFDKKCQFVLFFFLCVISFDWGKHFTSCTDYKRTSISFLFFLSHLPKNSDFFFPFKSKPIHLKQIVLKKRRHLA